MKPSREEVQSRIERFTRAMRDSGTRLTPQRLEIFREVAEAGDHPDAEKVFAGVRKRMPTVSLDTVYRTLWMLDEMGLVVAFSPQRGRVRFDADARTHHHFVCTGCGAVEDIHSREFDELEVPEEVGCIGEVANTHVQFRGLCFRCLGNGGGREPGELPRQAC